MQGNLRQVNGMKLGVDYTKLEVFSLKILENRLYNKY